EPFYDKSRIQGGQYIEPVIADAICKSVCMVAIYSPQYLNEEYTYCARELMAMQLLEHKRLNLLPVTERANGLIIPIIYRGAKYFPKEKFGGVHYYNFEKYNL